MGLAFIDLPGGKEWSGSSGMFGLMLKHLLQHTDEPPSLVTSLEFGIHSGTKYCNLSKCSDDELVRLRELLLRYREELPDLSRHWDDPTRLQQSFAELDQLVALMAT